MTPTTDCKLCMKMASGQRSVVCLENAKIRKYLSSPSIFQLCDLAIILRPPGKNRFRCQKGKNDQHCAGQYKRPMLKSGQTNMLMDKRPALKNTIS